jgi:hypothetical protein
MLNAVLYLPTAGVNSYLISLVKVINAVTLHTVHAELITGIRFTVRLAQVMYRRDKKRRTQEITYTVYCIYIYIYITGRDRDS